MARIAFADPAGVEPRRLGETELVSVTGGLPQHIVECEALRVRLVGGVKLGQALASSTPRPSWVDAFTELLHRYLNTGSRPSKATSVLTCFSVGLRVLLRLPGHRG